MQSSTLKTNQRRRRLRRRLRGERRPVVPRPAARKRRPPRARLRVGPTRERSLTRETELQRRGLRRLLRRGHRLVAEPRGLQKHWERTRWGRQNRAVKPHAAT